MNHFLFSLIYLWKSCSLVDFESISENSTDSSSKFKSRNFPKCKYIESLSLEEQNEELKKRLELFEIENEYLKKLAALVQQRKGQQQKKK